MQIFVSPQIDGTVGGLVFADEDILVFDTETGSWSTYFDGSDLDLTKSDIDALNVLDDGSILLSFKSYILNLSARAEDEDIVKFVPSQLGPATAGSFEMYFDGSDVGIGANEDIDAIGFAPDGLLLISFTTSASIPGMSTVVQNEDLVAFDPTSLGWNTAGTWEGLYFDGSDVGLTTINENVEGTWLNGVTGDVYLTTLGSFSVNGASGDGADVFICAPSSFGVSTRCDYSWYLKNFSGISQDKQPDCGECEIFFVMGIILHNFMKTITQCQWSMDWNSAITFLNYIEFIIQYWLVRYLHCYL